MVFGGGGGRCYGMRYYVICLIQYDVSWPVGFDVFGGKREGGWVGMH